MSGIRDKPGRHIGLNVIVDHDAGRVQIIRNLHDTKGCMVDSGNMGWMPLDEFQAFLADAQIRTSKRPTLMSRFGFNLPEDNHALEAEVMRKLRNEGARSALARSDIGTAMDLAPDTSILEPK